MWMSLETLPLHHQRKDNRTHKFFNNQFLSIMKQGKVKFFNVTKGFGFITPDDGTEDVFVHQSGLKDNIKENDSVQFEVERGKKGMNAVKVQVVH